MLAGLGAGACGSQQLKEKKHVQTSGQLRAPKLSRRYGTMKLKLMILSTGAALLMSPMWAQEQQKSPTTAGQSQESSMKTWTGTLHDADCQTATPQEKCEVTSSTVTFC